VNECERERACRAIVAVARGLIAGRVSYVDGARTILGLKHQAGLPDDPGFDAFALIRSETDHLPIGSQRELWSEEAWRAKEPDVRRAEEWARRVANAEAQHLVERFGVCSPGVSTVEILMRRALQRPCGQECVDWAVGMLERGIESRSLLLLAGMSPPFNHFELAGLRERVLAEVHPFELNIEDPVRAYVVEITSDALHEGQSLRPVFARVADLAVQLGYPPDLQPFYNLHFAAEDLVHSEVQWYWRDATRENVTRIMREEAQRFVSAHGG